MKVFISWSGRQSQQIAASLRKWLPKVIQATIPWMSATDVEKGTRWADEISRELEESAIGIICVTRENIDSPWLLFEAGALSKLRSQAHVCTYLHGLNPADIFGPLAMFQATKAERADTFQLIQTMNRKLGPQARSETDLAETFEVWWPKLERELTSVNQGVANTQAIRSDRELLEEILTSVRGLPRLISANKSTENLGSVPRSHGHLARSLEEIAFRSARERLEALAEIDDTTLARVTDDIEKALAEEYTTLAPPHRRSVIRSAVGRAYKRRQAADQPEQRPS